MEQFKRNDKNLVFYGDDTWLKLFPEDNFFIRHDGVTSFVASDYDEVDKNVTRHLDYELHQNDWQVMILHYLGLDHIGHMEGPKSHNMKKKLTEMDDIFMNIYESVTQHVSKHLIKKIKFGKIKTFVFFLKDIKTNQTSLIILLSDHGMADQGGHGGSTRMETEIPVIFFSEKLFQKVSRNNYFRVEKFNQIDLTSTLSCLFNLKIPDENEGISFIDEILNDKHYHFKNFHCLNENFKQLDKKYNLFQSSDIKNKYMKIRNEYATSLLSQHERKGFKNVLGNFKIFMKALVSQNSDSNQNYNQVYWMQVTILAMTVVSGSLHFFHYLFI